MLLHLTRMRSCRRFPLFLVALNEEKATRRPQRRSYRLARFSSSTTSFRGSLITSLLEDGTVRDNEQRRSKFRTLAPDIALYRMVQG
ncbi:hypothetical protein B296_00004303 [Ensete ventricosum]|uniref:Uncharacterized protein n=1 Tax=Ensete ventricosum TaxID=4639 RepID=A0A427B641_ENSVE|nr:hypothetical protein B296_00004303 [Ensete ventricosum]